MPAVIDNLGMFVRFTAEPVDAARTVVVATTDPARHLRVVLGPDHVEVAAADASGAADLTLPAEAFVRLVYGRLDPDHTPPVGGSADLDELRGAFPGS